MNTDLTKMPDSLAALMSRADANDQKVRPVDEWDPPYCGELDIRINRSGTWFYMGSPIGRRALVQLFASVLRKDEDGKTYLVTPVEKIGITVEDAPLTAVELAVSGGGDTQVLTVRTNMGDLVTVDHQHPLRFAGESGSGGLKPYVLVRGRIEALFTRALMYQLVDLMVERLQGEENQFGVWSANQFFRVDSELLEHTL